MQQRVKVLSDELVNNSNMLNLTHEKRKKDMQMAFSKVAPDSIIQVQDGGESFLEEIDDE